jgi:hypothetical protein
MGRGRPKFFPEHVELVHAVDQGDIPVSVAALIQAVPVSVAAFPRMANRDPSTRLTARPAWPTGAGTASNSGAASDPVPAAGARSSARTSASITVLGSLLEHADPVRA